MFLFDQTSNKKYELAVGQNIIGCPDPNIQWLPAIPINNPAVSRTHAIIHMEAKGSALIVNRGKNGTLLNNAQLTQQVRLNIGDVITIDFGLNGITDGPGYDMIYYERANPNIGGGQRGIYLDYVTIMLSTDAISWYTVFEWNGDDPGDVAGTNIDSYATDGEPYPGEVENEPIPWYDLYPGPESVPHNSGIAIDIGVAAQAVQPPQEPLPPGPFRWVRVAVPLEATDTADDDVADSIVRLN